jgi:chromosome partition protein MukF
VHRYLRDVVRLDPDRALSQRLRDQLASWPSRPFHLVVAHAAPIRLLRACEARVERPPVARPRADREAVPESVTPEDLHADLEALVADALAAGAHTLAEVTARVLATLPETAHYAGAGRIADTLARCARVRCARERPWAPVLDRLEVEDWAVVGGRAP